MNAQLRNIHDIHDIEKMSDTELKQLNEDLAMAILRHVAFFITAKIAIRLLGNALVRWINRKTEASA